MILGAIAVLEKKDVASRRDSEILKVIRDIVTDQNSPPPVSERKAELQVLLNELSFCPTCYKDLPVGKHAVAAQISIGSSVLHVVCDECPSD